MLEGVALHAERAGSIFCETALDSGRVTRRMRREQETGDDGLMVSAAPVKVIELPVRPDPRRSQPSSHGDADDRTAEAARLEWLSQPLSGRRSGHGRSTALVVLAALLLFALVFLSVTREAPRWPLAMAGLERRCSWSRCCIGDSSRCSEDRVRARDWRAWRW